MKFSENAIHVLFVEVLRRPHPRHQQGPGIDGGTLRVEGHSDGVGVCVVPQSGDEALVLRQPGRDHPVGTCYRARAAVRVSGWQDALIEDGKVAGGAQVSADRVSRHAPMTWNGHHLADMFRLGDLVILLHLVPALPRVITHGVEEVGRIAPRPQVDDGAVLLEVDTPPVPDRDVLARCKGTLASNVHAPIFHGEEARIDSHDHISGIAPLASTRGVQLRHIAVGDAVNSVVGALSVIAEGLIFIRPRGEELDQSSPTPNDRPTFYVEPIHPKRHHLVECFGNHLGGDRKADRALIKRILVSFTKGPVISVGSDLKRPYRRYAGGSRQQPTLLVTDDGDDDFEHPHSVFEEGGQEIRRKGFFGLDTCPEEVAQELLQLYHRSDVPLPAGRRGLQFWVLDCTRVSRLHRCSTERVAYFRACSSVVVRRGARPSLHLLTDIVGEVVQELLRCGDNGLDHQVGVALGREDRSRPGSHWGRYLRLSWRRG